MTLLRCCLVMSALGLAALALAACNGDDAGETVEMGDNWFEPETLVVAPGTPVTFDNIGHVVHNAIDVDGAWSTDEVIDPGEADTVTIDTPGTYTYYCSFHAPPDASGGMVGTIVVSDDPDAAVSDDPDAATAEPVEPTGVTRHVPAEFPTIQSGVDAAEPGDLVLVDEGVYREQVNVTTPHIVIRGTDRNAVVVDGELEREMGIVVTADGVAVENMTVREVTTNGFYWDGVTGFRGSYLTSINSGTYGIYAFDSSDGVFEHSYASGSADGAYYIGQCDDCRTILNEVTAEWSAFGFSGTNSSNSLYLVNSTWRNNGAGIVPNTLDSQRYPPSRGVTIAGNLIEDNGNYDAPTVAITWPAFGSGVMVAGGRDHVIRDNVIRNNAGYGVAITFNLDRNFYPAGGSEVRDNEITGSGHADLAVLAPSGGDCFADNDADRSVPRMLRTARPCDATAWPSLGSYRHTLLVFGKVAGFPGRRLPADILDVLPEPGDLEQLPGGADAEVRPAVDVFDTYDAVHLEALARPQIDEAPEADRTFLLAGFPVADMGAWQFYFALTGWVLPVLVLLALAGFGFVDAVRRRHVAWAVVVGAPALLMLVTSWPLAVLATLVTAAAYWITRPGLTRGRRWLAVGGGLGSILLLTPVLVVAGLLVAGVL